MLRYAFTPNGKGSPVPSLFDMRFGPEAVIKGLSSNTVRRIRHSDANVHVDETDQVGLVLNLSGEHRVEGRMAGTARSEIPRVGSVTVMPPGCKFNLAITGDCCVLHLRLPLKRFTDVAEAFSLDASRLDLRPRLNGDDPELARAIYQATLSDKSQQEAWIARIVELLVVANSPVRTAAALATLERGGMSPAKLRRVLEKIDADLNLPLTLAVLAAEAGMSPFHFSRVFAGATGLTPHQYILRKRVDRSVQLLHRREWSIDSVAHAVGFLHSSHLARVMRRLTGITPDNFRSKIFP